MLPILSSNLIKVAVQYKKRISRMAAFSETADAVPPVRLPFARMLLASPIRSQWDRGTRPYVLDAILESIASIRSLVRADYDHPPGKKSR